MRTASSLDGSSPRAARTVGANLLGGHLVVDDVAAAVAVAAHEASAVGDDHGDMGVVLSKAAVLAPWRQLPV